MRLLDLPKTTSIQGDTSLSAGPRTDQPDDEPVDALPTYQPLVFGSGLMRTIAFLLDFAIVSFGYILVMTLCQVFLGSQPHAGYVVFCWIWYYGFFESSSWQATPGKFICGLKVYSTHLTRPTFLRACIRRFALLAHLHPFLFYTDLYRLLRGQQILSDRISKTCVVKRNPGTSLPMAAPKRVFTRLPKRRREP